MLFGTAQIHSFLGGGDNSKVRHVLYSFNLVNLKGSTIVAHVTNSRNYVKKKKKTIIRLYTHCLDLIFSC